MLWTTLPSILVLLILEPCVSHLMKYPPPYCPDIFPSKSGVCPIISEVTSCDCQKEIRWCHSDKDCPGREKCCSAGCRCRSMCLRPDITGVIILPAPLVSICQLPRIPGPCIAAIPRWWYNPISGQCEIFRYGGCCGNLNNFVSREDCEVTCSSGFHQ